MATRLVNGGRIKNGVYEKFDKGTKKYTSLGMDEKGKAIGKVKSTDFGNTDVGKKTEYTGGNTAVKAVNDAYVPRSTIQNTQSQRNKDLKTQNRFTDVMNNRAGVTTPTTPTATVPTGTTTPTVTPAATTAAGGATATPAPTIPNGSTAPPVAVTDPSIQPAPVATVVNSVKNTDGTFTNTMSDGTTQMESGIQNAERQYQSNVTSQLASLDTDKAMFDSKIDRLLASNNNLYKSTLSSIKSTMQSRKDSLGQSYGRLQAVREKAGYQTDSFRYTPTHAEGLVTNDENNYIMQLAQLDAEEEALVLNAITAKQTKDWDALDTQMEMYDTMQTKKTTLLGNLLTTAQSQNNRIEAEAAIERELAEKLAASKSGDDAVKRAMAVAPVIAKAIANMSQEEAVAYVIKKAEEMGIDSDILRSQVIDRGREDSAYARSLIPKAEKAAKLTEEDIFAGIDTILGNPNSAMFPESDNQSMMPVPFRDPSGFLTPAGYKTLVSQARQNGVSKAKFLENYANELDLQNLDQYGLTAKEQENLGY